MTTDYDLDTPAGREFDAMVMKAMDDYDFSAHGFVVQSSPDGLGAGTGRWRLLHECPNRAIADDGSDTIRCKGCGQSFTYEAKGSR